MNIDRENNGRFKKGVASHVQKGGTLSEKHILKLKESWHKNPNRKTVKGLRWKINDDGKKNMSIGQKKRWDRDGRKTYKRSIHQTNTKEYKFWRMQVFLRDEFTCQYCGIRSINIEAHHIKSWSTHPELHFDINNGVTLCKKCHKLTDNYAGKKK